MFIFFCPPPPPPPPPPQGIGISLVLSQCAYGLYNIACVAWLFIYMRDAFITAYDRYRWTLCFPAVKYK